MNKKTIITISTILGLTVIVGGFWYVGKKNIYEITNDKSGGQEKIETVKKNIEEENDQVKFFANSEKEKNIGYDPSSYKGWNTYKNKDYGFEIKYPSTWEYKEYREGTKVGEENLPPNEVTMVTFGTPESFQGGHIWGISFFPKSDQIEEEISKVGSQFSDRKEKRKKVKFSNVDALLVTINTNQRKNWTSEKVYFSKEGVLFQIGNGAELNEKFEQFYSSFKFIK